METIKKLGFHARRRKVFHYFVQKSQPLHAAAADHHKSFFAFQSAQRADRAPAVVQVSR
jgi:hypothetical protein